MRDRLIPLAHYTYSLCALASAAPWWLICGNTRTFTGMRWRSTGVWLVPKVTKKLIFTAAAASAGLLVSGIAHADGPVALADSQLDQITAGGAGGIASASGLAVGLYALGSATTFSVAASGDNTGSPWSGNGSLSSGTVGVQASNISSPGAVSTSVQTAGAVSGNFVYKFTLNKTVQSSGAAVQIGFTYANGGFIPGLF